ncbi:MAG: non-canonical purine NTP pyrophosphatase, partial [Pseudoxanthomonas sp.]
LHALRDVPDERRTARFYCVLVLLRHATDPEPLIAEGIWEGRILPARQGDDGFGYDPVFLDLERGQSAAQLPVSLKNRISHRGQALAALQARLALR